MLNLLKLEQYINYLIGLKRTEELAREGGVSCEVNICDFEYLNNIKFYETEDFVESLDYIHDTYVFDDNDKIEIEDIQNTITIFQTLFFVVEDENLRKEIIKKAKKESEMEM